MENSFINKSLIGISIGIKFRPNFSIEDKLGEILDVFLYEKDSVFDYKFFPRSKNNRIGEKVLFNPENDNYLLINHSNIILDVTFSEKLPNTKSDFFIESFFKILSDKVYDVVDIKDISLVGIVKKYTIKSENIKKKFQNNIKSITLEEINSFDLTVTKKIILPDSKIKKDIYDYENAIISYVKLPDTENMIMQVDYQHIYEPKLDSVVDIKSKDLINRCSLFNKEMEDWVNNESEEK